MDYGLMWKWISILYRQHQWFMGKQLEPIGIGMGQYSILFAVFREPGINQDCITDKLHLNKSTVARAIAVLEENGFLTRETNPCDKRAYRLYPTGKTSDAIDHIVALCNTGAVQMMEGLSDEEQHMAFKLLERMGQNVLRARRREAKASCITKQEEEL